ncbi:hypothetical protein BGW42_003998 [Actinomortierella wolfii]|nr:hypothetical protein BGW42_003998 [Actinomortierella wolfii]
MLFMSSTPARIQARRTIIATTYPANPLHKFNRKMVSALKSGKSAYVFEQAKLIKEQNLKPDLTTYNAVLEAHELNHDLKNIMLLLDEMTAAGVEPTMATYNIALRAAAIHGETVMLNQIKQRIQNAGLKMSELSYEYIIKGLCANQELEHALDLLGEMTVRVNEQGQPDDNGKPAIDVRPTLQSFLDVITVALKLHESETAYLVLKMAELQAGLARIPATVYMDVLAKAAEDHVLAGTEYCWQKAVKELKSTPDEGICLLVLNCAGREKAPRLAADVFQCMSENGMKFREYHFAPLLQAFALAEKYKSAFNVLNIMRSSGLQPTILTASSLLKALKSTESINDAVGCMQEMRKEGKRVDVIGFNVVIEACARVKDLTLAFQVFDKASELDVVPDTDTFNALLSACISDKNVVQGKKVIAKMQAAGVDPSVDTYQSLIVLSLTQINYEDAFLYLEEMKSHDVIPSEAVYTHLVRKLARENDPRIKYAIEEMEGFGYVIGPNLREYIETGGLSNLEESLRRKQIRQRQRQRSAFHSGRHS